MLSMFCTPSIAMLAAPLLKNHRLCYRGLAMHCMYCTASIAMLCCISVFEPSKCASNSFLIFRIFLQFLLFFEKKFFEVFFLFVGSSANSEHHSFFVSQLV